MNFVWDINKLKIGRSIILNGKNIQEYNFTVRESSDFKPFRLQYTDETGVEVEIIAGMGGDPPPPQRRRRNPRPCGGRAGA